MTKMKTMIAALAAAGTLMTASVWAADAAPAAPAPQMDKPAVTMAAAAAEAEKAYPGTAQCAKLLRTAEYGLVWDVKIVREDGAFVRTFIDAKTGKAVAADVIGIRGGARAGMGPMGRDCPRAGMTGEPQRAYRHHGRANGYGFGHGFGPGHGYGHGMGAGWNCPWQ